MAGKFNTIRGDHSVGAGQVIRRKGDDSGWESVALPTQTKVFTASGTTSSGNVTFDVSSAGFTSLSANGCIFRVNDSTNDFSYQTTSVSNTSVTVNAKRREFTSISVVGINVLGSTAMANVPNGTSVLATFIGS